MQDITFEKKNQTKRTRVKLFGRAMRERLVHWK